MKTYRVTFEELSEVYIEAENASEARKKFINAEYDGVEYLATNMIDIEEAE